MILLLITALLALPGILAKQETPAKLKATLLKYAQAHPLVYSSINGSIKSPNYPSNYPNNVRKHYAINCPDPSSKIAIRFEHFVVESHSGCGYDSVKLYDGNSTSAPSLGSSSGYCGSSRPSPLKSTGNAVFVVFVTDRSVTYSGFYITYRCEMLTTTPPPTTTPPTTTIPSPTTASTSGCYQVLTSSNGSIRSPNFPSNYPNNANCRYVIASADPAARIILTCVQFNLESATNCRYDKIKVYDGCSTSDTQLGPSYGYCGSRRLPTMTSSGNLMLVTFQSDRSVTYSGFECLYRIEIHNTTQPPYTTAPHNVTQPVTTVPRNVTTQPSTTTQPPVTTPTGCHQYHNSMNGYIQSPNFPSYYPNNANCSYLISSPDPLARIVLTRVQFNLESHSYCRYDSVKIYNGWTSSAPRVGPSHGYCGNTFPLTCISTGNAMFITFTSDGSVSRSGFKLHYRVARGNATQPPTTMQSSTTMRSTTTMRLSTTSRPNGSGKSTHREFSGRITSPGYPGNYPNHANFQYLLEYPGSGLNTRLTANSFQLETNSACSYDFVEIFDGKTTSARSLGKYCSSFPHDGVMSSGDALLVVFKSDGSVTKKGFDLSFCRVNGSIPTILPPLPNLGPCGKPVIQSGRVIAGTNATRGAWPWQILMLYRGTPMCGGTLVSPNWVVTAAHCVDGRLPASNFKLRVGEHDIRATNSARQDIQVQRIIIHRNWNRRTIDYDIALMQLSRPVMFNTYVQPACLPAQNHHVPVGTQCFITGWGKIKHPGYMHHTLQQAKIPVVTKQNCTNLNTKNLGIAVTDRMVCAGHGGAKRIIGCHGDSGGPFVCKTGVNGTWVLHGAVSWGSGRCDATKAYTVFARVAYFRDWINLNIRRYSSSGCTNPNFS